MAKQTEEIAVVDPGAVSYLAGLTFDDVETHLSKVLEGDELSPFDLPRVTVPAGGGVQWMVPTLEDEDGEPTKQLVGVIAHSHMTRTYWSGGFTGEGVEPDCASSDAITGIGDPGGDCDSCPLAEWGSAVDDSGNPTRGQACKKQRLIYLFLEGEMLPIVINVPPSSIAAARRYFMRLGAGGRSPQTVETVMTLEKAKNKAGIAYSKIKFGATSRVIDEREVGAITGFGSLLSLA